MALAHQCAISLLKNAAAPYSATLAARLHRYKPLPDRYRLWEVIVQQHQNDDPLTCQIAWRNRLTPSKGPMMDLDLFRKETELTYKRYLKGQQRVSNLEGGGATDAARAL
jgi:hypothetical protein